MTSAMLRLMRDNGKAICIWAAVIGVALILFWISRETRFHQLAIGILLSSVSLFVAMSLFEAVWLIAVESLRQKRTLRKLRARKRRDRTRHDGTTPVFLNQSRTTTRGVR
jgi:hypothetical protein